MAVTAYPKDVVGANLATKVTQLTTTVNSIGASSVSTKAAAQAALRQAQVELVDHYMAVGRLDPASILNTMT